MKAPDITLSQALVQIKQLRSNLALADSNASLYADERNELLDLSNLHHSSP